MYFLVGSRGLSGLSSTQIFRNLSTVARFLRSSRSDVCFPTCPPSGYFREKPIPSENVELFKDKPEHGLTTTLMSTVPESDRIWVMAEIRTWKDPDSRRGLTGIRTSSCPPAGIWNVGDVRHETRAEKFVSARLSPQVLRAYPNKVMMVPSQKKNLPFVHVPIRDSELDKVVIGGGMEDHRRKNVLGHVIKEEDLDSDLLPSPYRGCGIQGHHKRTGTVVLEQVKVRLGSNNFVSHPHQGGGGPASKFLISHLDGWLNKSESMIGTHGECRQMPSVRYFRDREREVRIPVRPNVSTRPGPIPVRYRIIKVLRRPVHSQPFF